MPGIGQTLRDARLRAQIDMADVEARTKIRAELLQAIENEEWDLLPEAVYTKSFVRTYGNYLGLDSRMLAEEFQRCYEEPAEDEQLGQESMGGSRHRLRATFDGLRPGFLQGSRHRLRATFDGLRPGFLQGSRHRLRATLDGLRPGFLEGSGDRLRARFDGRNREFLPGYGHRLRATFEERGREWVILALGLAVAVGLGVLIAG